MGFIRPNDRLKVSTLNGWSDFILLEPLPFMWRTRTLRVRAGASTDGLSSPKWIKCDLQSTNSFFPTVVHDGFYRGYIEECVSPEGMFQQWARVQFTKDEADDALRELCEDNFVPEYEADALVAAVVEFGQKAWDDESVLRTANSAT